MVTMQNCLLPLSVTIVYIVLSTTTFSARTLAGELPESRPVKTLCLLRCAKEKVELKVISEDCVQSCQKELILDHTNNARKGLTGKSIVRIQRSINSMNAVINECEMSSHYPNPREVKGLTVDFSKNKNPHVKISWKAIDHSQTDFNWTAYAVIYTHSTREKVRCKVVPKNQTQYLVPEEDWKFPDPFYAEVVTHPYNGESPVELKTFDPIDTKTMYTPSAPAKDTTKLVASIAGGVIAGLVLLVVLYFIIKWKKAPGPCPVPLFIPRSPPPPPRKEETYYACYYPEGEDFRKQVASIVNYFRHHGYNVTMDVMDSGEISSQGPSRWAENQMRKATKVLVFLTPALINLSVDGRADSSQSQDINRVWIELEVLRDIYTRNRSASKMVCITLPGASVKSMDLPLWAKVSYKWPGGAKEIMKRLNDRPTILPL